jgi:hypothetical protein
MGNEILKYLFEEPQEYFRGVMNMLDFIAHTIFA